jgi:hypothetical protein
VKAITMGGTTHLVQIRISFEMIYQKEKKKIKRPNDKNASGKTIKSSYSHDQSTISSLRAHDNNNPKRTQFQLVFI